MSAGAAPYAKLATYYDSRANLLAKQEIVREIRRYVTSGFALDLACGTGNVSRELISSGFMVDGIDLSVEMLEIAKEKCPSARFMVGDIESFSFPPEFYTAAVCVSYSLNYLGSVQSIARVLDHVGRSLIPGGVFLFDLATHRTFDEENIDHQSASWAAVGVRMEFAWSGPQTYTITYSPLDSKASYWEERHAGTAFSPDAVIGSSANLATEHFTVSHYNPRSATLRGVPVEYFMLTRRTI